MTKIKRKPDQTGAGAPSQSQVSRMLRRADEADVGERPQPRGITEAQIEARRQANTIGKMIEIFEKIDSTEGVDHAYKKYGKELATLDYTLEDIERFCDYIKSRRFGAGIFISAAINKIIKEEDMVRIRLGERVDFLGMLLERGTVVIEGDAGNLVGTGMRGGRIVVSGNALDYTGQFMKGGEIVVNGDGGDCIGREMTGGKIKIRGNVGNEVGYGMKEGLIEIDGIARGWVGFRMKGGKVLVNKNVENDVGIEMEGGEIVVGGNAGSRVGYKMKGGKIVVNGDAGDLVGWISFGGKIIIKGGYLHIGSACKAKVVGELRNG